MLEISITTEGIDPDTTSRIEKRMKRYENITNRLKEAKVNLHASLTDRELVSLKRLVRFTKTFRFIIHGTLGYYIISEILKLV